MVHILKIQQFTDFPYHFPPFGQFRDFWLNRKKPIDWNYAKKKMKERDGKGRKCYLSLFSHSI